MSEDIFDQTHEVTFHMAGRPLTLRLTAPPHKDAGLFLTKIAAMRTAAASGQLGAIQEALTPQFVADVFAKWVEPAEPIKTRNGVIATGAELYAVASPGLVMAVVGKLMNLASMTEDESKESASPSISASAASEAPFSDSPATSIEPAASPESSIAPETPVAPA